MFVVANDGLDDFASKAAQRCPVLPACHAQPLAMHLGSGSREEGGAQHCNGSTRFGAPRNKIIRLPQQSYRARIRKLL